MVFGQGLAGAFSRTGSLCRSERFLRSPQLNIPVPAILFSFFSMSLKNSANYY
jgi:hypothetical protein